MYVLISQKLNLDLRNHHPPSQTSIFPSNRSILSSDFSTFWRKIKNISQKQTYYGPKKSKTYSLIMRNLIDWFSQIAAYYRVLFLLFRLTMRGGEERGIFVVNGGTWFFPANCTLLARTFSTFCRKVKNISQKHT